jgi:CTD small phosphatase-like protein 2
VYAEQVLDKLDPDGTLIQHKLYREACLFVHGNLLKDLNVLGRDLSTCIIVDNSPYAFGYQLDNGIPVSSWFCDDADTKLMDLSGVLGVLKHPDVVDVRPTIRELFGLADRVERVSSYLANVGSC